jgi:VanZ family protein
MELIYAGSTDLLSSARTSPFVVTLLRWLKPDLSDGALALAVGVIRKGGHLTEYAVLASLVLAAMNRSFHLLKSPWSWSRAALALAWCAAYAASDEFHQSFVPTRTASGWDVLIDTSGALTVLVLIGLLGRVGRAGSASAGGHRQAPP